MHDRKMDFELVINLLNGFLKNKDIRKRLHYIVDNRINDWEKWLQIEFEQFIAAKRFQVKREVTAYLDPFSFPQNRLSKVDIILCQNKSLNDGFIFIEFKCTKSIAALKRGLEHDMLKIQSIIDCEYKIRNSFFVGFHLNCKPTEIDKMDIYVTEILEGSYAVFKICPCPANHNCNCTNNEIGVVLC